MPCREDVFNALLDLLKVQVPGIARSEGNSGYPIKTYSRRMTLPAQVDPGDLPCLMLWDFPEETVDTGRATPPKRTWSGMIVFVFRNDDKKTPGASILNPILDQVDTITQDAATDVQTLGGLVQWVKIIGQTVKETGDTDPNGLGGFVCPVKILVP